jgi:glycerol-3-phosphate acyltransferase PlsY
MAIKVFVNLVADNIRYLFCYALAFRLFTVQEFIYPIGDFHEAVQLEQLPYCINHLFSPFFFYTKGQAIANQKTQTTLNPPNTAQLQL